MGNIDFSKEAKAILENAELSSHLVSRLGNLSEYEKASGIVEIKVKDGEKKHTLEFVIGPPNEAKLKKLNEKKLGLSLA